MSCHLFEFGNTLVNELDMFVTTIGTLIPGEGEEREEGEERRGRREGERRGRRGRGEEGEEGGGEEREEG